MDALARLVLPHGLVSRPPEMEDADAVTGVINRQALHDAGVADTTVERTLTWWQEPTRDLARDSLVVATGAGQIVASIDFSEYDPFDENEFDLAVDPAWRGRGIEEFLVDWAETRARESIAKAPDGLKVTLETRVWAANTTDQERLRQLGYAPVRYWDRMEITLDTPPRSPDPVVGINVRTARTEEIDAVHDAWEDAQQDEFGSLSLTDEQFRYYFVDSEPDFDPSLWFLAVDDASDQIVGYVLGRLERPGDPDCGHIRYVAVRRAWRRRGIASVLLAWSFRDFYERGKRRISLAVDSESPTGAHLLYERAGMRPVQRSVAMMTTLRPANDTCRSDKKGLH